MSYENEVYSSTVTLSTVRAPIFHQRCSFLNPQPTHQQHSLAQLQTSLKGSSPPHTSHWLHLHRLLLHVFSGLATTECVPVHRNVAASFQIVLLPTPIFLLQNQTEEEFKSSLVRERAEQERRQDSWKLYSSLGASCQHGMSTTHRSSDLTR